MDCFLQMGAEPSWVFLKAIASWGLIKALLCQFSGGKTKQNRLPSYQFTHMNNNTLSVKPGWYSKYFSTRIPGQLEWKPVISNYMVLSMPSNSISSLNVTNIYFLTSIYHSPLMLVTTGIASPFFLKVGSSVWLIGSPILSLEIR